MPTQKKTRRCCRVFAVKMFVCLIVSGSTNLLRSCGAEEFAKKETKPGLGTLHSAGMIAVGSILVNEM
jgi:hypothetical protein